MDNVRQLKLLVNGNHIAKENRIRFRGKTAMTLRPDMWQVDIFNLKATGRGALQTADRMTVCGTDDSMLADGKIQEIYSHTDDGQRITTIILADGMDFWSSTVSFGLGGKNTAHETIRTLVARCSSPVAIVDIQADNVRFQRGQAFHGRTVNYLDALAKSLQARAYYTRNALHIAAKDIANTVIDLTKDGLILSRSESDGLCIARISEMRGYSVGQLVQLPETAVKYRLLSQSFFADTQDGLWQTELVMVNENKILYGEEWGGG